MRYWHLDLARQKAITELRLKIVPWVEQQPDKPGGYTWADLQEAGVVTDDDAAFLRKHGYQYLPTHPKAAPSEVLLLRRINADDERYVHCDGSYGYRRRWPSPMGDRYLLDIARPEDSRKRMIQFGLSNGLAPQEYRVNGHYRKVLWNPSGNLAAMNTGMDGTENGISIWYLTENDSQPVPLPDDFSLEAIFAREAPRQNLSWGTQVIEAKQWLTQNHLLVHMQGVGSYTDADGIKHGVNLIGDVTLEVTGPKQSRVSGFNKRHFAVSAFQ